MDRYQTNIQVQTQKAPLYLAVKSKIRQLVQEGIFIPGTKLPPETELATMFNVSRNTLREALRLAQREGWVVQKHGVGTFVSHSGLVEEGLEILESIDSQARREGWESHTMDVSIETQPAEESIAEELDIGVGTPVVRVSRIKTRDRQPIAYLEDYFPATLVDLDEFKANFKGSVLDFFIARGNPSIEYAWTEISAILAGERFSEILSIPQDEIILLTRETVFSEDAGPFHFSFNYLVMKFFKFHIVRMIPEIRNGVTV